MKKYILFCFGLILLLINLSCKENCQNIEVDRSINIFVYNSTTIENISSTLTNNNFKIIEKDLPGLGLFFNMNFEEDPISAIIISYSCENIDNDEYDRSFDIIKEDQIIGEINIEFVKVNKGCDDCDFQIKNLTLIDIEGEVNLEELNNQMSLFIE